MLQFQIMLLKKYLRLILYTEKVDLIIDDLGLKQISDSNEIDKIVDDIVFLNINLVENSRF